MARLFFSYTHKDEELRDELEIHWAMLRRQGLVETVHDRRILAGKDLDPAIDAYIDSSDVILSLLSPDFIASEYCYSREMMRAITRHDAGQATLIPVILRRCEWQETPLGKLRATPKDGKPVTAWADRDEAFNDVTKDIRKAVEARAGKPKAAAAMPTLGADKRLSVINTRPRSANLSVAKESRIWTVIDRSVKHSNS